MEEEKEEEEKDEEEEDKNRGRETADVINLLMVLT